MSTPRKTGRITKTRKSRRLLRFRDTPLTSNIKSACTNKDTRGPTWRNLTELHWKERTTLLFLRKGVTIETSTRSCNPIKEEAAPWRPENTLKTCNFLQWKQGEFDQSFSKSRCRTVVIVVFVDMVSHQCLSSRQKIMPCADGSMHQEGHDVPRLQRLRLLYS